MAGAVRPAVQVLCVVSGLVCANGPGNMLQESGPPSFLEVRYPFPPFIFLVSCGRRAGVAEACGGGGTRVSKRGRCVGHWGLSGSLRGIG